MYKITSSSFVELRELNHLSRTSIEEEKFLSRNLFIFGYNDTNNKVWLRNQSSIFFFFVFPHFRFAPPISMINKNNGTNQHVKLKFSAWVSTPSTIAVAYLFPVIIRIYDTRDIYDKSGINRNQFKCVIYK